MRRKICIAVLGDGGWGTALSVLLSKKGFPVRLWGAFPDYVAEVRKTRLNTKFLPGVRLPAAVKLTGSLPEAVMGAELVVLAVPSEYLRGVLARLKKTDYPKTAVYLSVVKGIETTSLLRMSEVIHQELGRVRLGVLSGPTIALEVAAGIPAAAVAASHDRKIRLLVQEIFMTDRFRIYTSDDVAGVELGGSLKNIIAIACGISDGMGFGTNTKAAILSRGLAEISRLGTAMRAKAITFSGISGLGDLVTTCFSPYSRNRSVGEQIGKGRRLADIRRQMKMVAEGIPTAKSAHCLSRKLGVEMPITEQIYSVLYKDKSPAKAVKELMTREKKAE